MKIIVRNNTNISNKYIRFIKWKLYQMKKKFKNLLYAEVFIKRLTNRKETYRATIKLGVPGKDIVISHKEHTLSKLWKESVQDIHRYLNKQKRRSINLGFKLKTL